MAAAPGSLDCHKLGLAEELDEGAALAARRLLLLPGLPERGTADDFCQLAPWDSLHHLPTIK
jgi:hypothetical protein